MTTRTRYEFFSGLVCFSLNHKTTQMLTIQIDDAQLEQRIVEAAKAIGQTAQEFLRDLAMRETKTITKLPFEIPRLNVRAHSHIYAPELTEEELLFTDDPSVKPFSHVTDTITFSRQLRTKSWRKL
jgi:hypothetical protein